MTARWDLVVLSPHFDDAALSCGGAMHARSRAGASVLVVTVCAGGPADPTRLSAYAASLHRRWAASAGTGTLSPAAVLAARRAEDERALARLGAAGVWLDVPDAVYRRDPDSGRWPYATDEALFGQLDPGDAPIVRRLGRTLGAIPGIGAETDVLAPLAAGSHVDHCLVRAAAAAWRGEGLWHYEDYPYAADPGSVTEAHGVGAPWRSRLVPLSEADLEAKIEAVALYASQISTFWPDEAGMAAALRAFADAVGGGEPAERQWRPA